LVHRILHLAQALSWIATTEGASERVASASSASSPTSRSTTGCTAATCTAGATEDSTQSTLPKDSTQTALSTLPAKDPAQTAERVINDSSQGPGEPAADTRQSTEKPAKAAQKPSPTTL
jgi:hypothetical protein